MGIARSLLQRAALGYQKQSSTRQISRVDQPSASQTGSGADQPERTFPTDTPQVNQTRLSSTLIPLNRWIAATAGDAWLRLARVVSGRMRLASHPQAHGLSRRTLSEIGTAEETRASDAGGADVWKPERYSLSLSPVYARN